MKQLLIALDQLANTLVWAAGEGFGLADETLSARAWRLREREATWGRFRKIVDRLFFWETDHCKASFDVERGRGHLPRGYMAEEA